MRIRLLKDVVAYRRRDKEPRPLEPKQICKPRMWEGVTPEPDGTVLVECGFTPVHLLPGEWEEVKEQKAFWQAEDQTQGEPNERSNHQHAEGSSSSETERVSV